jgi:lipoyl(octanoyl) transferase
MIGRADRIDAASSRLSRKCQDSASTSLALRVRWLGRMDFADALALQEELVAQKRNDRSAPDELLLLEHEPVYTIGRTPDRSSLLDASHLPHPLFPINRGGQATYHGPGQLMGYPIVDLRRCGQDLHRYLRWLEQLLIELLADYEIVATRLEGLTGVWVEDRVGVLGRPDAAGQRLSRKIASIGVGVRHWISMHGFALNVSGDLSPFAHIIPCGISNVAMTSMEKETGNPHCVIDIANRFERLAVKRIADLRVHQAQPATIEQT